MRFSFPEVVLEEDLGSRSGLPDTRITADGFYDDHLETTLLSLELFLRIRPVLGHVIHYPPLEVGWVGARCQDICLPRSLRDTAILTRTIRHANLVLRSTTVFCLPIRGYSGTLSDQRSYFQLCKSSTPSTYLINLCDGDAIITAIIMGRYPWLTIRIRCISDRAKNLSPFFVCYTICRTKRYLPLSTSLPVTIVSTSMPNTLQSATPRSLRTRKLLRWSSDLKRNQSRLLIKPQAFMDAQVSMVHLNELGVSP